MSNKKTVLRRVAALALAVALAIPSSISNFAPVTDAKAATFADGTEYTTDGAPGQTTTGYLAENMVRSKMRQATELSEEYWDNEAPADAKEAAEMYVKDYLGMSEENTSTSNSQTSSINSGTQNSAAVASVPQTGSQASSSGTDESQAPSVSTISQDGTQIPAAAAATDQTEDGKESLDDLNVTLAERNYDENGLRETAHNVRVTYTIAHPDYLTAKTIDEFMYNNINAFLGSIVATSPVYESKYNEDCYVAFLNYGELNNLAHSIVDADFITNIQVSPKDVEKDIVFDKNTGIVYIPKSYYFAADGTEIGYDLQAQLLVAPPLGAMVDVDVTIENHSSAQVAMTNGLMSFTAYNTLTIPLFTPETADEVSTEDIVVYLNDSSVPLILDSEDASYNMDTGEFTINRMASSVYSVRFEVAGKTLAEKITDIISPALNARAAGGISGGEDMNFVKNGDTPITPISQKEAAKLKVGDVFKYDTNNSSHLTDIYHSMLEEGQKRFIYAPYLNGADDSTRDAFYDALSAEDSSEDAKSLKNLLRSMEIVAAKDQNASADFKGQHRYYAWYMFACGAPSGELKRVNGSGKVNFGKAGKWKWSDTFKPKSYTGGNKKKFQNMFVGMCCHVGAAMVSSNKSNQVSVLEKGKDYVVLGIVQTSSGTTKGPQAGATMIKIKIPTEEEKIKLKKVSAEPEKTDGNPAYSLEGAQYTVYSQKSGKALSGKVGVLTTDAKGNSNELKVAPGTYYVKESKPSKGFQTDTTIYTVKVTGEEKDVITFTVKEPIEPPPPQGDPFGLTIYKINKETGDTSQLGAAPPPDGAEFTIKYYEGEYTEETLPDTPTRTWIIKTQMEGDQSSAQLSEQYLQPGSDPLYPDGIPRDPKGTLVIEETKAPEGWTTKWNKVTVHGEEWEKSETGRIVIPVDAGDIQLEYDGQDYVRRGDVWFTKIDSNTKQPMPFIPFRITSMTTGESHVVVTDENGFYSSASWCHPHDVDTNANDSLSDGSYNPNAGTWFGQYDGGVTEPDNLVGALPYEPYDQNAASGYTIEELPCAANEGKSLFKGTFYVKDNMQYVALDIENPDIGIETTAKNDVTGTHYAENANDLTIVDLVEYWGCVDYKEKSYTVKGTLMDRQTGEAVKDKNGQPITSERTFQPKTDFGQVEVEFTCDATDLAGHDLVVFEELYCDGEKKAEHRDINDEDQTIHIPKIGTTARDDKTQIRVSGAAEEAQDVVIRDVVEFQNLKPGHTYRLVGRLMDKETGKVAKDDNGDEITSTVEFMPETPNGKTEVTFTFPGTKFRGRTLVAFEKLYYRTYRFATHEEIEDEPQTIHFPKIGTTNLDRMTDDHIARATEDMKFIDTVHYENLLPGYTYNLHAALMDQETGEPALDDNGDPITSYLEFEPEDFDGDVDVEFVFTGKKLAGKTLVAFERLYYQDCILDVHQELKDEVQSIHIPRLETQAVDVENGTHTSYADEDITITDTVEYENVLPGKEYTVKGVLMDKETGKPILDDDGNEIQTSAKFTAKDANGSIEVTFKFSGVKLAGKTVVAFEELYYKDVIVGVHADIEDDDQSIYIPEIKTQAVDVRTGTNVAKAMDPMIIKDIVTYKNLEPHVKYRLEGTLMDKWSKKPVLDDNGETVTAKAEFTPEDWNGTTTLTFKFPGATFSGKTLVVFEKLFREGAIVAHHEDLRDRDQTIFVPEIQTEARDQEPDYHAAEATKRMVIKDTVKYWNLFPGRKYKIKGVLMVKETGLPLIVDGQEVTAEAEFTPTELDGEVELTFTFDGTGIAGNTLVAYETLYEGEFDVAVHTDIEDEDQSVHVPLIETQAQDGKNGMHMTYASEKTTIKDTVKYWNLFPGKTYKMHGVLMDKATKKPLLVDGKQITADLVFKPEKPNGQVVLSFTFDSSALKGKTVVAFETLYEEKKEVAVHADITDEDQSSHIPKIGTEAKDVKTGMHMTEAGNKIQIKDSVTFENLIPGKKYTLKATLMDKDTGKPALDDNGDKITAEIEFIPNVSSGRTEVTFTFSGTGLAGKSLVAFERLYYEGKILAAHTDINDEDQTVNVPKIETEAQDEENLTHLSEATDEVSIVDKVHYEGLIPGQDYTIKGTLMNKETGLAILIDNNPVTAQTTFTANHPSGYVDLTFTFDGTDFAGKTLVAFETLYFEEHELAVHADINDEAQTIYMPEIHTTATDPGDGDQKIGEGKKVKVVDRVYFNNLIPGRKYRIEGRLMDKSKKTVLKVNGKKVKAEDTFTAVQPNGYVDLVFTFDSRELGGKKLVAFEKLFDVASDARIATHEDLNDRDQTMTVTKTPQPEVPYTPGSSGTTKSPGVLKKVQTGDSMEMIYLFGSGLFLLLAGLYLFGRKRRRLQ